MVCPYRVGWTLVAAVAVALLVRPASSVGAISVGVGADRSEFSRSLDALRVRDNHYVRGIPCAVACDFCGCEGSHIGEKCVCFCSANTKESTACLTAVRKDELNSGIDNDILILTRTGARFARDVRQWTALRARMGRGASVSWKAPKSENGAPKGYVGNVKIYAER